MEYIEHRARNGLSLSCTNQPWIHHTSGRHGAEELGHTSSRHGAEESGIISFALTICDKISKPRDELFNKFT